MRVSGLLGGVAKLLRLPAGQRRCALEAVVQLTRASLELRVLPAPRTVRLLGTVQPAEPVEPPGADQLREAALVGSVITRVAARLPWRPTCLRQALAAKRMLARRGIVNRLHLGVTGAAVAEAHAWVTVGDLAVVGRPGVERFVPLAAFG
jgi:hypothetical protein